ncbi:hypothetical protein V2J09_017828, partial [Rumex salicifolius]
HLFLFLPSSNPPPLFRIIPSSASNSTAVSLSVPQSAFVRRLLSLSPEEAPSLRPSPPPRPSSSSGDSLPFIPCKSPPTAACFRRRNSRCFSFSSVRS